MIVVAHNLTAMYTADQLKTTAKKKNSAMEKLSSGYRINRAADDAAGLSISETMRKKIRALKQGASNTSDGVSWVQIGDGALEEVDDMLHRMNELCISSLNGTKSEVDRDALQQEYDALRTEIDRISVATEFNEQNIFNRMSTCTLKGCREWESKQLHQVIIPDNTLIVSYSVPPKYEPETATVEVPEGRYTTEDLIDTMNDQFAEVMRSNADMYLEHTNGGTVDLHLNGGSEIGDMSGALTYLFHDVFYGGNSGQLIGTTSFKTDSSRLYIVSGQNDELTFDIYDSITHQTDTRTIRFSEGSYTKQQLIDTLNEKLADTSVRATSYGQSIRMGSDDCIITRFKGNMFKIDGGSTPYNSVFYDNTYYGNISTTSGLFKGGAVIPEDPRDQEHNKYIINSTNNKLVFSDTNNNGRDVTITIPEGSYTLSQMIGKLNALFADPDGDSTTADGLGLTASVVDDACWQGIRITSQIQGYGSKVGLVESNAQSTAFNTLFKDKKGYGYYASNVSISNNTTAGSSTAKVTGAKTFTTSGTNPTLPLNISSANDKFTISLTNEEGTSYSATVTVASGDYNDADSLISAVNTAVKNAVSSSSQMKNAFGSDIADKINVTNSGGRIVMEANGSSGVVNFRSNSISGNNGYTDLLCSTGSTSVTQVAVGSTITLNTKYDSSTVIDDSNKTLTIMIGNQNSTYSSYWANGNTSYSLPYTVTLPTGNVAANKDAILDAINNSIDKGIWLDHVNYSQGRGTSYSLSPQKEKGQTIGTEGGVGSLTEVPSKITVNMGNLSSGIKIDGNNNKLSLSVNANYDANNPNANTVTKTMTLTSGNYTKDSFLTHLQTVLDSSFGSGTGGVIASYSGNNLVFTVRTDGTDYSGMKSNISVYNESSTAYNSLLFSHSAASKTYGRIEDNVTITSGNTAFNFMYSDVTNPSLHSAVINLDPGDYTRAQLIAHMNQKLSAAGIPITASATSGGKLTLTTNGAGSNNTVKCTYDKTTGSAMPAIFGGTKGVTASFDASGKLKIVSNESELPYVRVTSANGAGSVFQTSTQTNTSSGPSYTNGAARSYIQGTTLDNTTVINEWNNDFKLTYSTPGKSNILSITMDDGSYTKDTLASALQTKLNEALHAKGVTDADMSVVVRNGGLRIYAGGAGSSFQFTISGSYYYDTRDGYSGSTYQSYKTGGDFYDHILNKTSNINQTLVTNNTDGSAVINSGYPPAVIGRRDVVTSPTLIRQNVNDTLSIDVSLGSQSTTVDIKIAPGSYTSNELKTELQSKFDQALASGAYSLGGSVLEQGTIKVGVGGISSGVAGANDGTALNFSVDLHKISNPGDWKVEGIGGTAAFSIFYQTDGEPKPAYVKGSKDVSRVVEIKDGQDTLSMDIDGKTYKLDIPHGNYTPDGIIDALNNIFVADSIPVMAEVEDGVIKISHNERGHHEITNVNGNAKGELFFNMEVHKEDDRPPIWIQMSDEVGDGLYIDRPIMNATILRLQRCGVDNEKDAMRSLKSLDFALKKVSVIRSTFGAEQNRMEHALLSNNNTMENLTAAESRIRDTDMASEMVRLSVQNILQQAGFSMLAQQNQDRQSVLNLLS